MILIDGSVKHDYSFTIDVFRVERKNQKIQGTGDRFASQTRR
jgi:hypothetical protein